MTPSQNSQNFSIIFSTNIHSYQRKKYALLDLVQIPQRNMYCALEIKWAVQERKKRKQIGNSSISHGCETGQFIIKRNRICFSQLSQFTLTILTSG